MPTPIPETRTSNPVTRNPNPATQPGEAGNEECRLKIDALEAEWYSINLISPTINKVEIQI